MRPVEHVNPLIGAVAYAEGSKDAHGFGKTFPGATTPFGMVQLSPDTITGGDHGSGYSYTHDTLEGFSFTHLSGVGWYGDMGNFLVTPTVGPLRTSQGRESHPEEGYRSRIDHAGEIARAGYYAIRLDDYGVLAEMTAAPRAGIMRLTFPRHDQARIQIDLARRVAGTSTEQHVRVVDKHTICGWMKCPPEGGGFGDGGGKVDYTLHFCCRFSRPLDRHGVWSADIPDDWPRGNFDVQSEKYQAAVASAAVTFGEKEAQGRHLGFFTEFSSAEGEVVLLKCGISYVSIEGAMANLEHDIPDWDFEAVRTRAEESWNRELSKIRVEGGTPGELETFYTALYHTLIDPRCVSDVSGEYRGADGKVHRSSEFIYRSVFSGWDVFRSQFPLQTIINPSMVNDSICSLLHMAEADGRGYLSRWELLNADTDCMLGNPGVSVIADAYLKGIRNYDAEKALACCRRTVDRFGNGERGYAAEEEGKGSVSETLEYAYSDWCFARLADQMGQPELAAEYDRRSKAYRNIWNEEIHWFRGRNAKGEWLPWEGKTVHGQGCRESNPYQQGWFVPHDLNGHLELMGPGAYLKELTELFEKTPEDFLWNDYYNHPNEPVHNVAFLFNRIGKPSLTQKWTRRICARAYGPGPFGLCGNEDVGQMSAWYVLAAIGIHPVCPGDGQYEITSPVFSRIEIDLDPVYAGGGTFVIAAANNGPDKVYIQSMRLNGKPVHRHALRHKDIAAGGTLDLVMGSEPVDA